MNHRVFRVILPAVLLALTCRAQDFRATQNYRVAPDQTVSNELWLQARTIVIRGTMADDCFLLADSVSQAVATNPPTVQLAGVCQSDVWALGEGIEVTGSIRTHARLAATKSLAVAGAVGGNLMAAAPTVTLATNAVIAGSAVLAGQDILLHGTLAGNARIFANKATLSGTIGGDCQITANDITIMPGTRIAGNLVYRMENDLVLDSRVELGGKIIKADWPERRPSSPLTAASLFLQVTLLCGAILAGLVFMLLMPGFLALSVHKLSESPWRCLLLGFIIFALVPMTAFFLLFTLVGIPLSALLALAYLIMMYLAKIVTGLHLGHVLLRRKTPIPPQFLLPTMALGLFVLYAGVNLPFPAGLVAWFALTLCGMGALAGAMLDRRIPVLVSLPPAGTAKPPPLPGNEPPGAV